MQRFFILLLLFPLCAFSQINESFGDGNFNLAPQWTGNDSHFIVNTNNELQLNNTEAGTSYLSTACQVIESASWVFRVKMDFNPSSSNYTRIYLASNSAQLNNAKNAIYVELGNTDDNICLYKIMDDKKEKVITGTAKRLDMPSSDVLIRVKRTGDRWTLESDMGSGWTKEGQATFEYNTSSNYFGWFCQYTKTRATKFYLDDIVVTGQAYRDKTPPEIVDFNVINGSVIQLELSEAINDGSIDLSDFTILSSGQHPTSYEYKDINKSIKLNFYPALQSTIVDTLVVENIHDLDDNVLQRTFLPYSYKRIECTSIRLMNLSTIRLRFNKAIPLDNFSKAHFHIDNQVPEIAKILSDDEHEFTVNLSSPLSNGQQHQFRLNNLIDAIGDTVIAIETDLLYYQAKRFDMVINEYLADPTPSMGLPELEYIELMNTSPYPIYLDQWRIKVNDKTAILPDSTVNTGQLICLVNANHQDKWIDAPASVFVQALPTLNNSSCDLVLINQENEIIDATQYNPNAIPGETFKRDGGWAVECIDASNHSGTADNYQWSLNLLGGTPGFSNSVEQENKDVHAPLLSQLNLLNTNTLELCFNEAMQFTSNHALTIEPTLKIQSIQHDTVFLRKMQVTFELALDTNAVYLLKSIDLNDLANIPLKLNKQMLFGLADSLTKGDIVINEILFNPLPDGADFVELYNQSDKILRIKDIHLTQMKGNEIEKLIPANTNQHWLFPHSYLAITSNKTAQLEHYNCLHPDNILDIANLPSYPDNEGYVVISDKRGTVLDELEYSEKMHSQLLKSKEGVSLERLQWHVPSNEANNWYSATSTAGYATPGYDNSQQVKATKNRDNRLVLINELFTPDGDGIDDRLQININEAEQGGTASIRIYNSHGQVVRYLLNNENISASDTFFWDGLSDSNELLTPGIYIIYMQCFYPSGKVIEEKVNCVIGIKNHS
ncbi:lamin tail domain-containing protein [Carboxylicivirga sp. M1479]|uniref:lamin tail domain-containing protein n=1 Tax=Carboxylicivirga sp. M1479 TaxID=2594476 RepID=UPI00117735F9|nr:lamin tail domain-containing protein [Carboxylicivirga sp. M1479]TRX66261.1 hypothetical protein FNN09_14605 [Carboxylicivirga sp. M1479]